MLLADLTGRWPLAVQRIRIDDVDDALEEARALMRETGTRAASWWLSEHSTPDDVEQQLLDRGLEMVEGNYLIDGLLLTREPPPGPPEIEARAVESVDEYVEAMLTQFEAFDMPAERRRDEAELREEYERTAGVAVFAAWLGGELIAAGRDFFTPRGMLMVGGSTLPAARGRGAYRALVRARWDAAVAAGTPALVVQAGTMSAPILPRLGFERVVRFRRLHDQ